MALDRKDVRAKLDPPMHELLCTICEIDGLGMNEWVEQLILAEMERRISGASVIAQKIAKLGISGSLRESPGKPAK